MAEHIIGALADFPPGSQKVVSIGKLQVGIFNVDGVLYALPNICPHQFGPICTGRVSGTLLSDVEHDWNHYWGLDGRVVACPWHGIEFDIATGQSLASPRLKVRQYQIAVVDGQVRLTL
jgi:nitrite reductase/ring-hydroxylating ferredoxin subunit